MTIGLSFLDGIWAAIPTPFDRRGNVDIDGVERNTRHFADTLALDGIFCNGLMGEGWSLTANERQRITETILATAGNRMRVGVVTSHHSLTETIALSRHAADNGADHIVLMRPQGVFDEAAVSRFVLNVAEAANIPIVLFDGRRPTGGFAPDTIAALSSRCRIVGVKCTRPRRYARTLRERLSGKVTVTDPEEAHWLPNMVRSGLKTLYADPEPYLFQSADRMPIREYARAYAEGNVRRAREISRSLKPLRHVYLEWIIGRLHKGLPPNAALKLWCEHLGMAGGPVRPPLTSLSASEKTAFRAALARVLA